MRNLTRFSSLALSLAVGPVLLAQSSTGSIVGVVKDHAGAPLANAKITLASPALFAPRVVVTDAKGEWRAFLLPAGVYRLTATADGYVSSGADDVRVGLGSALRQDLSLKKISEASAVVEVVSSSVGVDKSDTKTSVNFNAAQLEAIPTGAGGDRAFKGALSLTPGVVTETPSGRVSMRGSTVQGVQYRVNGADVKNDYSGEMGEDGKERWVVEDNIEDIQVVLSPLHARYGRNMGGQVNVVTKSGSNDFRGSVRATFSRDSWRALGPNDEAGNAANRADHLNTDYQVTLGGPIIKDRLWFSLATILTPSSSVQNQFGWFGPAGWQRPTWAPFATGNANIDHVTGAFNGGHFTDPNPAVGAGVPAGYTYNRGDGNTPFNQNTKSSYLEAKLSGAINQDHIVEFAFMNASEEKTNTDANDDVWHTTRIAALGTLKTDRYNYAVNYRGSLSSTLYLEAMYATNGRNVDRPKGDEKYGGGQEAIYAYGSGHQDVVNGGPYPNWRHGMPFGVWSGPGTVKSKSTTYNVNLKWLADDHQFDFGLDGFKSDYMTDSYLNLTQIGANNRQFNIGGQFSNAAGNFLFPVIKFTGLGNFQSKWDGYFPWDAGLAPTMVQYLGPKNAHVISDNQSVYANDMWTLNAHWNVMLGLRFDSQKLSDATGKDLAKTTDISPRLQVRYDIHGDSRQLITFTAAQYTGDFSQSFASAFAANAQSKAAYYGMTHTNGGTVALPTPGVAGDPVAGVDMYGVRFVDYATLVDPRNYKAIYKFADNSTQNVLDGSIKPPVIDEVSLGYNHAFTDGSNVRFTYVRREWKRQWAISEDYAVDQQVLLTDPTGSGLPPLYGQVRHYFNSDDLKREYNALETEFNVKTKGIWSWGGSWTYSRLTGNDEGGDDIASKSALRDNTPSQYFLDRRWLLAHGVPESSFAPYGRLGNDATHRIRLYTTATIPFGKGGEISFSWMGSGILGTPWGVSNQVSLGMTNLGADSHGVAYTQGDGRQYASYMGGRRPFEQNDIYRVDFRMAFKVPLSLWRVNLFGDVMVNNFFNTIRQGQYVQNVSGSAAGIASAGADMGNPNWTDNRMWTQPRSVTASLGLRF
ncbi:TonB-dependent receptor [Geothrix sp. PMB-07]|uniref:TonB-dependent receptor n=1 Tax=Geothrix sp. PMB-07 TaxID=3068640 RepID=UPI0027425E94|nr:TonB-dependent receptor [Geothrix sp. PMB-07]WLT31018.1 TonB-dependent receptor [Geothrix sp. PMB-07]